MAERARQNALESEDAQDAVREVAFWSQKGQQGMVQVAEARSSG
jgi:hypothetical protein